MDGQPVTDIAAFLTACWDGLEAQARDHLCIHCGNPISPIRSDFGITGYYHDGPIGQAWQGKRCPGRLTAATAMQNPEYLLADIAAKRRILARHTADEHGMCSACISPSFDGGSCETPIDECPELCDLAEPFKDRPGYDPAWVVSE